MAVASGWTRFLIRLVGRTAWQDGRKLWARLLYGVDDADEEKTRAIGSLHQALVSGVLVQWLIDPGRAPSPAELALGLQAIAEQVAATGPG